MTSQSAIINIRLVAHVTAKTFFVVMKFDMFVEINLGDEGLLANIASEWTIASMHLHVHLKGTTSVEFAVADVTLEGFWLLI